MSLDDMSGRVSDWSAANGLCLIVKKTFDIKFTFSCVKRLHSPPVRFLGIHLESGLNWETHIGFLVKQVCSSIFVLRVLSRTVSVQALRTIYYAHVNSKLAYGTVL